MITTVIFDYGDTLVVKRKPGEKILPWGVEAAYLVFKASFPRLSRTEFIDLDRRTFERFAAREAESERDIQDELKYSEIAKHLGPALPQKKLAEISSMASAAFWKVVADRHVLRTGCVATLRRLDKMGIQMAVVSNHHSARGLNEHLDSLNIRRFFSAVLASADYPYRKPDSRIFRRCTKLLGCKPSECAFVGDSIPNDVVGANRMGMTSILVKGRNFSESDLAEADSRPRFVIARLSEIPGILKDLNVERTEDQGRTSLRSVDN